MSNSNPPNETAAHLVGPKGIFAIYEAAHKLDAEISAMSWGGFNLAGDRKSISELERLMFCEARLRSLEQRISDAGVKL